MEATGDNLITQKKKAVVNHLDISANVLNKSSHKYSPWYLLFALVSYPKLVNITGALQHYMEISWGVYSALTAQINPS